MVNYQVFLSFRGTDTRHNLVEYLHKKLDRLGIATFLDSKGIKDGDTIDPTIEEAIQRSDICVPVFSLDFASSRSCLMEVDCMVRLGKKILPIFFFIEPSDVQHQRGTYEQSFAAHECKGRYPESTIAGWKRALTEIGAKKGRVFKNDALKAALENTNGIKGPDFKKAALEAALETIDGIKGPELKMAALEALETIDGMKLCELKANLETALEAALEETDVIEGPDLTKAVEAALEKIGVRKGRENTKAALEATLAKTGGQFYKDLFKGFQELEDFISELWKLLKKDEQVVTPHLVGIDRDMPEIMRKLGFTYQNGQVKEREMTGIRILIMWGTPGAGKTTLTKEVFNKIRHLFKGCSFLEEVSQGCEKGGVLNLQRKLIGDLQRRECPKVRSPTEAAALIKRLFNQDSFLIVLDDVDDLDQIKPFAEELTWFGPGSTIILTTEKKDVYKQDHNHIVSDHEVKLMDEDHALQLFSRCVFGSDHPPKEREEISRKIISAVDRSPFAISTVGSSLSGEKLTIWERTLDDLQVRPRDKVKKKLEESYDRLSYEARQVFLDIACFFTGVEKTIPCYLWDARGQGGGVDELKKKSLLQIRVNKENKEFWMYRQLKLLGRNIVKSKYPHNPGKRSRVWDVEDVQRILGEKTGFYEVEALRVPFECKQVDGEVLLRLSELRFLELDNVDIGGNPEKILPSLQWLDWRGCQEKSKLFAFDMERLEILKLCSSSVQLSLKDWGRLMKKARILKVLNLKDCSWIKASLEFPASEHLERLILEACLYIKPETISNFKNLVSLSMKHCKGITELPRAIASCSMTALEELLIDGTDVERLHFEKDSLPALKTLSACECEKLREVTDSIGFLKNLQKLTLRSCSRLKTLPPVFGGLAQLKKMDMSYTRIKNLPLWVWDCRKLLVLKMARTFLTEVPEAIKHLEDLKELDFTKCKGLRGKRCDISGLFSLRILRLQCTGIIEVLARDEAQCCLHIIELDDGVTKMTRPGQNETAVSQPNRKRKTQTSEKNSCVSQNKRRRDEE